MTSSLNISQDNLNFVGKNSSNIGLFSSSDVGKKFQNSVFTELESIRSKYKKVNEALGTIDNVVVLKSANFSLPESFSATKKYIEDDAKDAYGFVSKEDKSLVIIEDNHKRKPEELEGSLYSQGQDTLSHEVGHLVGNNFSQTDSFKSAYCADLKNIEKMLSENTNNAELKETLAYLKHYIEGVNFADGIDENDVTARGLKENFAECFSTVVDENPSKINEIYSKLFKNTMAVTKEFVV